MMTACPHIRIERDGTVLCVTFDRPDKKNALTGAMYVAATEALRQAGQDTTIGGRKLRAGRNGRRVAAGPAARPGRAARSVATRVRVGAVGTLQNVATISSTQITPVVVPVEVPVVGPVTTCAATGDVAKSSAVINASFFMCALVLRWSITDQAMRTGRFHCLVSDLHRSSDISSGISPGQTQSRMPDRSLP